jgi:hypothetical protein
VKKLIKKILKEDDWDWAREIPLDVDSGYFTEKEESDTSLSMAEKVMKDHKVDLEGAVDLMWENFPYEAENVFNWHILNPRTFDYEGVEYITDVDPSGSIGIQPVQDYEGLGRGDRFYFYATPNYHYYGVTPINYVVDDDYVNHHSEVVHPKFGDVEEMKDYYRNQHTNDVMGTILDYMDEHYNYSNVI